LVWGEQDGEVLFHPDEAVTGAIRTVFERFAEFGSARRVWLWFRSEGLSFPLQTTPAGMPGPIRWVKPLPNRFLLPPPGGRHSRKSMSTIASRN